MLKIWKMKVFRIRQSIAHIDQRKPLISKMLSNGRLWGCWGLEVIFEVAEAKISKAPSFYDFSLIEFSSFRVLRSFDLGNLGVLEKSWGNIFNDYIYEISRFHWSKCNVDCAIYSILILESAQARCAFLSPFLNATSTKHSIATVILHGLRNLWRPSNTQTAKDHIQESGRTKWQKPAKK